jgi:hypothetical protein
MENIVEKKEEMLAIRVCIHQPFSRTFYFFLSKIVGVFHSPVLESYTVFWNTVLECLKGIFQHSSSVLFWMEYFRNTVLIIQNESNIDTILNHVVIQLTRALHLDLFRTARTCSEERDTLFQNIPLI